MTEKEGNLKHVDQFVFTRVLGKGSSVTVYQANDQIRKNIVAIKQISFAIIKDVNSFKRECIILKKLKHENIIKLIGIENTKKNCHLICEYCNGGNLFEYKRFYQTHYSTQLNELFVQKIIRQVIKGLEYLHLNGMIHRDIKLDNILLNFNSVPNVLGENKRCQVVDLKKMSLNDNITIKIADLGLAKELKLTKAGTICGIPITASNDKTINNTKTYNTKVDLWSLGSITYELLVGREPSCNVKEFQDLKEEINKAASSLPKSLQLSIEAISFINGLLQFSPEKRMTWDEIKSHPFIVKHPKHFHIINLSNLGVHADNNLELRSKSCDNYLWLNFANGSFDLELDKINNETMENQETMRIVNEKQTVNEELQKAIQNDNSNEEDDFIIDSAQIEQSVFKMKMETEQKLKQVEEMKKTAEEEKRLMYEETVRIKENILKEIEELKLKQQQEKEQFINLEKERIQKQKEEQLKFEEEKTKILSKLKEEESKLEQKRIDNMKTQEENQKMLQNAKQLKEDAERQVEEILKQRQIDQLSKEEKEKYHKAEEEKKKLEHQIQEQKQKEILSKFKEQTEELEKLRNTSEELKKQLMTKDKIQNDLETKQKEKDCLIEQMKQIVDAKDKEIIQMKTNKKEQELLLLKEKHNFQEELQKKEEIIQQHIIQKQKELRELQAKEEENQFNEEWGTLTNSFEHEFQIDEVCTEFNIFDQYF